MLLTRFPTLVAALSLLVLPAAPQPPLARHVKAEVSLNGLVLLEASISDDGRPDADAVWNRLKGLTLQATDHFRVASRGAAAGQFTITDGAEPGEEGGITVHIRYGGKALARRIELLPVAGAADGSAWQLLPAEVDRLFAGRFITRREAAGLTSVELPRD